MKKTFLLLIAMMASFFATAQTATFKQVKHIVATGKDVEMSGTIKLEGDNYLELNYTNPQGDYFIINGNKVKVNMNGKKNEVNTNRNARVRSQAATLMNCVTGNWRQAAADNDTETEIVEKNGSKTITLTAKKKQSRGYSRIVLTYEEKSGHLTKLVLEEFGGVVNTYTMTYLN